MAATESPLEHLAPRAGPAAALGALPEPLARWFGHRFGAPTPVQCLAWPALAAGRNVLISAPTGTGKTLAAFLPLLGGFLRPASVWNFGTSLTGLYLAPL